MSSLRRTPGWAGLNRIQTASWRCFDELKIDASSAVYIGDRPEVDAAAAKRAGIACIILGRASGLPPEIGWLRGLLRLAAMLGLEEKTQLREVIAR